MRKNKIISEKQLLKILHLKKYEKADKNRLAHNRQQIYKIWFASYELNIISRGISQNCTIFK